MQSPHAVLIQRKWSGQIWVDIKSAQFHDFVITSSTK